VRTSTHRGVIARSVFRIPSLAVLLVAFAVLPSAQAAPDPVSLGQAFSFGVLAGSTVTNTGPSVVHGNVGVSTGTAVTGFPPGTLVDGTVHSDDALARQAQTDLGIAYDVVENESATDDLTGQDLGGLTLFAGVYNFDSSAQLTGNLILDALGDPGARFDFQIGSTLTTASASMVTLINGANANNVFFQVGSSATLGAGSVFTGNILALTSITLTTGATLDGRALARNGAVTLDTNRVGITAAIVPEPGTLILALSALGMAGATAIPRRRK
jgi:hypothetical protein